MFGQLPPDPRIFLNRMVFVTPTTQGKNPWLCVAVTMMSDGWHLDLRYPDTKWDVSYKYFTSIRIVGRGPGTQKAVSGFESGVSGVDGTDF